MGATTLSHLADHVRTLPAMGPARDRRIHQLIDDCAAAEAAAALKTAAQRANGDVGVLAQALRSAVALWDANLEPRTLADYGEERGRLHQAATSNEFVALIPLWIRELRKLAVTHPDTGACTLASTLELWWWTMDYFRFGEGARGEAGARAVHELADMAGPLLAARCLVLELAPQPAHGTPAEVAWRTDLSHVHAAHTAARVGSGCAELVFGYRRHPRWDAEGCATCYSGDELDELDAVIPGIACGARATGDVIEADGSHASKAGPCAGFTGVDTFVRLRTRLDGCLTGARFARDRAASVLARSVVPASAPGAALEGRAS